MDEDVDMVEVRDPHEVQSSLKEMTRSKKRSKFKAYSQLTSLKEATDERRFLKAKRLFKDYERAKHIFVLDTNILVDHSPELKFFNKTAHNCDYFLFILPLVVIQELDSLKTCKEVSQSSINLVNELLSTSKNFISDKKWLKEFPDDKVRQVAAKVDLLEMNNDDMILKTSLIIKELSSKCEVILVTNDINLQNKALATDLCSLTWSKFHDKFKGRFSSPDKQLKTSSSSKFQTPIISHPKLVKFGTNQLNKPSSSRPEVPIPSNSQISPTAKDFKLPSSDNWRSIKNSAEKRIVSFIKTVLRKNYGEELWDKIFDIDFDKCTLSDALDILKKGWVGNFGDVFRRDQSIKDLVSTLHKELSSHDNNFREKIELTTQLVEMIEVHEKRFIFNGNPSERLSRVRACEEMKRKSNKSGLDSDAKRMHIDPIRLTF